MQNKSQVFLPAPSPTTSLSDGYLVGATGSFIDRLNSMVLADYCKNGKWIHPPTQLHDAGSSNPAFLMQWNGNDSIVFESFHNCKGATFPFKRIVLMLFTITGGADRDSYI